MNTFFGKPTPPGISPASHGYNFALFCRKAATVKLILFDFFRNVLEIIELDPKSNKTGDIWHIDVNLPIEAAYYAYQIDRIQDKYLSSNPYILDPYAKEVSSSHVWGSHSKSQAYSPLGVLPINEEFDWQGICPPLLKKEDLIIYEMHVRGFTLHNSSSTQHPGTFLGVIEKIPYFLELGINAIELLPIQEFDENEVLRFTKQNMGGLYNYWGYSTANFFSPMKRYATSSYAGCAIREFKMMVRELHRHGIEVILDMVFNHTAEGNEEGPIFSFKALDSVIYYQYDPQGHLKNYTGCGNTFNCNHPIVRKFILDCLHYWVLEMHVDGFRFDLAAIFQRGVNGEPLAYAPLVEEITEDPLLATIKLIAEPWDAAGLYQVGAFATRSPRWMEWNDKYRDDIRKFIKGTPQPHLKGDFITRICGSQDLYGNRSPLSSLNFITAHDGFTLRDLVSYNDKHNLANRDNNRDGHSKNESWNCGVEGVTKDKNVENLRERQMRNFHVALMISQGIPMLLMGDEYGHTRKGNNNAWCQDNELNWFLWDHIEPNKAFFRFYKKLIHFRKKHTILRRQHFLTPVDVDWHGVEPFKPNWNHPSRVIAFTLLDHEKGNDLYIIFNSDDYEHSVELPPTNLNMHWHRIVNTANPSPTDFFDEVEAPCQLITKFVISSYAACVFRAQPRL